MSSDFHDFRQHLVLYYNNLLFDWRLESIEAEIGCCEQDIKWQITNSYLIVVRLHINIFANGLQIKLLV